MSEMRRVRMGIAGGGPGSLIGPIHCRAARLDGKIDLVAGAFSSDPHRSLDAGRGLGIERSYGSFNDMLAGERARPDGMEFLTIATPNHLHATMTRDALAAGFHVFCDKPATSDASEISALAPLIATSPCQYALAHTYTGYPLVRQARQLCLDSALGDIRSVAVEYYQGWLSQPLERSGNKQAQWRADPALAGVGGCLSDIGVHAFNLAEFVTGLQIAEISADLLHAVPGRVLDDGCNILLGFSNGARGSLNASQIATGARNGLRLRVHGSDASLDWNHEHADRLIVEAVDGATRTYHAGGTGLSNAATASSRLPAGHPEGFIEALANLYADFTALIVGSEPVGMPQGLEAAWRGMHFVATAIESHNTRAWRAIPTVDFGNIA